MNSQTKPVADAAASLRPVAASRQIVATPVSTPEKIKRVPRDIKRYGIRIGALLAGVLLWHFATRYDFKYFINFENVPGPTQVSGALIAQLGSAEFYLHVWYSLLRIAIAYGLAAVVGVTLGVMVGRSRWAEDIVLPYIELLRPIPAVAWIPLAILMMPSEESSIIFITFLGALFPIVLNTVHGVEQTPDVLLRAARSLGASKRAILWHVVIPGAMPSIVAGLAIAMGVAWFSLLAGEIISGQYGIGYFTWTSYTLIQYPQIIIGMLTIGGLGTLSTLLIRAACAPLLRWQKKGGR